MKGSCPPMREKEPRCCHGQYIFVLLSLPATDCRRECESYTPHKVLHEGNSLSSHRLQKEGHSQRTNAGLSRGNHRLNPASIMNLQSLEFLNSSHGMDLGGNDKQAGSELVYSLLAMCLIISDPVTLHPSRQHRM